MTAGSFLEDGRGRVTSRCVELATLGMICRRQKANIISHGYHQRNQLPFAVKAISQIWWLADEAIVFPDMGVSDLFPNSD